MSRKDKPQTSGLFLLELLLAILFFSIASTVCVRFFVKAHLLSADSGSLNMSVYESTGIAEVIRSSSNEKQAVSILSRLYPYADSDTSVFTVYYDSDFQACTSDDAVYAIETTFTYEDLMLTGSIESRKLEDNALIYSLTVKKYISREGSV